MVEGEGTLASMSGLTPSMEWLSCNPGSLWSPLDGAIPLDLGDVVPSLGPPGFPRCTVQALGNGGPYTPGLWKVPSAAPTTPFHLNLIQQSWTDPAKGTGS